MKNDAARSGTQPRTRRVFVIDAHGESTSGFHPPQSLAQVAFLIAWRMMLEGRRAQNAPLTRETQALQKPACVLWRDGGTAPPDQTWSSSGFETRGSYSA